MNKIKVLGIILFTITTSAAIWQYGKIIAMIGLLLLGSSIIGYSLILIEQYLIIRQKRKSSEREVITAPQGHQVIVRDPDKHSVYRQIHLTPSTHVNGRPEHSTNDIMKIFSLFNSPKSTQKQLPLLLENQAPRHVFDLLNEGIHFSLIGSTDSGKTTLANHFIDRIKADSTYALDPHAKFNEWSIRCKVSQTYDDIEYTLQQAFLEMTTRYDNGPSNYTSILLAIDEWPAIIQERPECERYIARISREGRKVDVRLILLSQSDQIQEIGMNMAIRNNFLKIALNPELTRQNKATIRHWDKTEEIITLAGPYQGPSQDEIILTMHQNGESIKAIAENVLGTDGGNQRRKIERIVNENV